MKRHLLVNAIITPDGTRIQSFNTHDYKSHKDLNGETYVVDGGLDYLKRSVNKIPYTECSLYSDDSFDLIRESFHWGTYGKGGKGPLTWKSLSNLDKDHIEAILATQKHISNHIRKLFIDELTFRNSFDTLTSLEVT